MKKNAQQNSVLEEVEKWCNDKDVTDDSVSKILNKKSQEQPNIKKISKIWG
ncbi:MULTISPECIES: hypothetical protein [unclassified Fibrobacter]|uniref:hypothetical protein n=1 Tax=unclassified Fibrobacter TaxID=2634177 RepID=UPI000D7AC8D8|nr:MULTISPECIES: hypothetical protein [unclassified Fibrobacter]PWJ63033.1 hypothetical protein BGX12_11934 [Fibrobacter sp. UWR4]PZW68204.1 hypothetical protein C8E88_101934 [Fibrobacter sp. UWR1]